MSIEHIEPREWDYVITKCREFFKSKGLVEVVAQHRLSILAACEDPETVTDYHYNGDVWPLPQTSQMWLEYEIMKNPEPYGYYAVSFSYRQENLEKAIEGRHNLIFPMIEFEIKEDMNGLIQFEREMLEHLGFGKADSFPEGEYLDMAKKYSTNDLEHEHEQQMWKDYGNVFFLKNFPESTSPFFNMKRNPETGLSNKVDVIICGMETFGSAERSCDPEDMRKRFHTISDGEYAQLLYTKFRKDRVEKELEKFLASNWIQRSGCGIGSTRLISAMKKAGLMPDFSNQTKN